MLVVLLFLLSKDVYHSEKRETALDPCSLMVATELFYYVATCTVSLVEGESTTSEVTVLLHLVATKAVQLVPSVSGTFTKGHRAVLLCGHMYSITCGG